MLTILVIVILIAVLAPAVPVYPAGGPGWHRYGLTGLIVLGFAIYGLICALGVGGVCVH